jgi:hypothetical protein
MNAVRQSGSRLLPLLVPWALLLLGSANSPQIQVPAPGKSLSLPTFSKEGWRATLLRAATARYVSETQIDATDVNFTVFKAGPAGQVETVLTSPAATALTDQEVLRGDDTVRLVRDDVEITGAKWSFARRENRVFIGQDARVVFHTTLNDLLK